MEQLVRGLQRMFGKPKVAILTSLTDFSSAYSLTGIILDQARMLHRADYDYDLIALRSFNEADKASAVLNRGWKDSEPLRVKYCLSQVELHDYAVSEPCRPEFDSQCQTILSGNETGEGYLSVLEPYDVIITHDLMFLSWYLPQNWAIRKCIERWPRKRWLHWCHSGPSVSPNIVYPSTLRYQGADRSQYVFLNFRQRQDLANMMRITPQNVAVVYNPKDPRDVYQFSRETCDLIDFGDLLDHEILQTYAFSTPRWESKGVKHLLTIFGEWRLAGIKAKLVLVNAHCTQERDETCVRAIEEYAARRNLVLDRDVIITSRFVRAMMATAEGDRFGAWSYSVPARTLVELNLIGNMFLFPSVSECCSLIQAEASISNKFVVLNRDFPAMLEFSAPASMHYEFTRNDPDTNPMYYRCVARELWAHLQADPLFTNSTMARVQTYNRDWIWRRQVEPLLYIGRSHGG